MLYQKGQNIR